LEAAWDFGAALWDFTDDGALWVAFLALVLVGFCWRVGARRVMGPPPLGLATLGGLAKAVEQTATMARHATMTHPILVLI